MNANTVLLRVSGVMGIEIAGTTGPQERLCLLCAGTIGRHDEIPGSGMGTRRRWLSGYCICPSIRRRWFKHIYGGRSLQTGL